MQTNMQAGLDLPQKITVFTNPDGKTVAGYNSTEYIANRHGVAGVATLEMISGALSNFVTNGTAGTVELNSDNTSLNEGIISVTSNNDMDSTYIKIIDALNGIDPISIIAEVDHQANAAGIGETLNPSKLVVFGNPALGSPLMQESQSIAVDLPQKMLVYQNENDEVKIIYNDPFFIAGRHGITANDETLTTMSNALMNIANAGAE